MLVPPPRGSLRDHVAAVGLGYLAHDREPETGSRACRAPSARGRSGRRRTEDRPPRSPARGRERAPRRRARPPRPRRPAGLHFAALSRRLPIARSIVAGHAVHGRLLERRRRSDRPGWLRRARSTASAATRSRRTSSGSVGRAAPCRASSISSAISEVISPSCSTTSESSRLALLRRQRTVAGQHLDVRAEARQRRAQLVRRVGHELPLRAGRILERREHRVEARREPAELVPAADVDPLGQVAGLGHPLGRIRQPPHRRERGARDDEPERRGYADAGQPRSRMQERPHARERVVDLGQRAGRPGRAYPGSYGTVRMRTCVPDDVARREKCPAASPRATAIARVRTGSSTSSHGVRSSPRRPSRPACSSPSSPKPGAAT